MAAHESHIDRMIREATERGEFDNLPGAGKPLEIPTTDDPDWWVKQWMQREQIDRSTVLPPAMALRRERAAMPESLVELPTESSVREVVHDYNRRVRREWMEPTFGRTSRPVTVTVDVDEMVEQWRPLRAEHDEQRRLEAERRRAATAPRVPERRPFWRRRRHG